jgi:hypothetical protein
MGQACALQSTKPVLMYGPEKKDEIGKEDQK